QSILLNTSASLPLTSTPTGETTSASGLAGNDSPSRVWPLTAPSPVTLAINSSPARAGLADLTGEKSSPWKMAGLPDTVMISGRNSGINGINQPPGFPPLI